MVGLCRLELQTSSVSRKRSNQLSYRPLGFCANWALMGNVSLYTTDSTYPALPCQGSESAPGPNPQPLSSSFHVKEFGQLSGNLRELGANGQRFSGSVLPPAPRRGNGEPITRGSEIPVSPEKEKRGYCVPERLHSHEDFSRLPLIAADRIADAGSTPATSTSSSHCKVQPQRENQSMESATNPRSAVVAGGGGVPVSTGCCEVAGGNEQATDSEGANHKGQEQSLDHAEVRGPHGLRTRRLIAAIAGSPAPGNRSGHFYAGVSVDDDTHGERGHEAPGFSFGSVIGSPERVKGSGGQFFRSMPGDGNIVSRVRTGTPATNSLFRKFTRTLAALCLCALFALLDRSCR